MEMHTAIIKKMGFVAAILIGSFLVVYPVMADGTTSSNWAGYVAQQGVYTGVSGTWKIPEISYSDTLTSNATWVGIGGKNTPDLIQAGVYQIATNQGAIYQAWYELLPDDSTAIELAVHPGDSLSVAIVETSPDIWNIVVTNNTSNKQFEKTVSYHSSQSSVEWVQERPLVNQQLAPLSGFTPIVFTGASAVQNGQRVSLAQTNPQILNLLDTPTNTALAVPSAITGTGFTVMRTSAISTPIGVTILPSRVDSYSIPQDEFHRTGHDIVEWITPDSGWVISIGRY